MFNGKADEIKELKNKSIQSNLKSFKLRMDVNNGGDWPMQGALTLLTKCLECNTKACPVLEALDLDLVIWKNNIDGYINLSFLKNNSHLKSIKIQCGVKNNFYTFEGMPQDEQVYPSVSSESETGRFV